MLPLCHIIVVLNNRKRKNINLLLSQVEQMPSSYELFSVILLYDSQWQPFLPYYSHVFAAHVHNWQTFEWGKGCRQHKPIQCYTKSAEQPAANAHMATYNMARGVCALLSSSSSRFWFSWIFKPVMNNTRTMYAVVSLFQSYMQAKLNANIQQCNNNIKEVISTNSGNYRSLKCKWP